jgi:hypothetical protein
MSETPHSVEGQDFIAPDESQRIHSPEKAWEMAKASDAAHTIQVQAERQQALREQRATPLSEYTTDMSKRAADAAATAEAREYSAGIVFEAEKQAEIIGTPSYEVIDDYEQRVNEAQRDVETFRRYLQDAQLNPVLGAERSVLEKISDTAVERMRITETTLNILKNKRREIDGNNGLVFSDEYAKFKEKK